MIQVDNRPGLDYSAAALPKIHYHLLANPPRKGVTMKTIAGVLHQLILGSFIFIAASRLTYQMHQCQLEPGRYQVHYTHEQEQLLE